jgi:predicted Rossmann fold flavoprotein
VLDLVPGERPDVLDQQLQSASRVGRRAVAGLLPPSIPRRLAESVLVASGVPADRTGPELTRDERRRLLAGLKGLRLPIEGTLGFAKAEVTSGGVALGEVDPETLESRRQPGLHFVGEVLDLDGLIGGYNFQAAWSTGWLAGGSV